MNWRLGGPGVCPRKILKIRTLEMSFPAIWALNYEFDFKKGKTLGIVRPTGVCTPVQPHINPPLHN